MILPYEKKTPTIEFYSIIEEVSEIRMASPGKPLRFVVSFRWQTKTMEAGDLNTSLASEEGNC